MNLFGLNLSWSRKGADLDSLLQRLEAAFQTASNIIVTPENCEEAPTVQAVVNAISMHFQALPVHVYLKGWSNGRETKELLPNHPVAKLLAKPNQWQTPVDFWGDAASTLVRYNRFFAVKLQGATGPIRRLIPVNPSAVQPEFTEEFEVYYRLTSTDHQIRDYKFWEIFHARGRANDFLNAESPVVKAREAIALEMAAQKFGSEFFGNGAMPGLLFQYAADYKGHTSKEQRDLFLNSFREAYGKGKRFRAALLPAGIQASEHLGVDNEAMQFLDTRKLQRTIIAGAFGVPPHLVGDLERGTFSNIEHQSQEFINKVILPYARMFEAAMERDLLTDDDRRSSVVIRFNLDAMNRADFKTRQEGLKIQREMGIINPNEWREREGMNPRKGGDEYWDQGPSGQGVTPPKVPKGSPDPEGPEEPEDD